MLKQSALFKSRSNSNDLSNFLRPKSHDDVTGKTRQNLMSSMGMDAGPSQEEGDMGGSEIGPGGMGTMGAGAMGGGMPGMAAMGGNEGMSSEGGMGNEGGMEGLVKMAGGMGGLGGMNDQVNAMNGMGGMPNSDSGGNPMEGLAGGNNAMNPMNNAGPEGMMSDSNQLPAGDPMGTLKSMMDNQGTNAALGMNSEAFGPGGSANTNVLAMLNQIVGKEMPGESPVDPSSKSQQMWDQLQKSFVGNQKDAVQPYIDSSQSNSAPIAPTTPQNDVPPNPAPTNKPNPPASSAPPKNQTIASPIYNLTGLSKTSSGQNKNLPTPSQPKLSGVENVPLHATNAATSGDSITKNVNIKSKAESHENGKTKTTSNPAEIELDDDQPLSDDMVKFLKGIKFVVSQEPGNDIILGKKFTSDLSPVSRSFKEENGVMKNVVSHKFKGVKRKNRISADERNNAKVVAVMKDIKGIDLGYARNLLLRRNVNDDDSAEYKKAAKVLERASKKLKDPIAKKSTEIAIASILKVIELKGKKKASPAPTHDFLNGGDVKSAISERYFEAARVLGTASKKLADPVAKKSTEIGIAAILKVIVLDDYSMSKKHEVPLWRGNDSLNEKYSSSRGQNQKRTLIAAKDVAHQLTTNV